jgi:hypothetical protein
MIKTMDEHYSILNLNTKKYSGEQWARKLIINLWKIILELWKTRNKIIFDAENQQTRIAQRDKLESRIKRCYDMKEQLSANDCRLWFEKDLDDKLQEEPNHLCNWLMMTERLLRIAKREKKKRPRSSMIMHRFLGLPQENNQATARNTLRINPKAYPQDMNPD